MVNAVFNYCGLYDDGILLSLSSPGAVYVERLLRCFDSPKFTVLASMNMTYRCIGR